MADKYLELLNEILRKVRLIQERLDIVDAGPDARYCDCCEFPNNHTPEEFAAMDARVGHVVVRH